MNNNKKEIYIYGAGKRGKELLDVIRSDYNEMICVEGFIDRVKNEDPDGNRICSINDIPKDSVIVISIANFETAFAVASELRKNGFQNFFWYNIKNKRREYIDFFKEQCADCSSWGEDTLLHVEIHAMDACNLNCKGCTHFAPLFEKKKPDTALRTRDFELLRNKISSVVDFYIMGGEPLLNDELIDYIKAAKSAFPDSSIVIVTNGLLIPKCSDELLDFICKENVCISISEYAPTHQIIDKIIEKLLKHNVIYNIREFDSKQVFNLPLSMKKTDERYCISKGCINIYDGKIACCPTLIYLPVLNQRFGTAFPEDGIIDLSSNVKGLELKEKLSQPVSLCDYCSKNEINWNVCSGMLDISDFVQI